MESSEVLNEHYTVPSKIYFRNARVGRNKISTNGIHYTCKLKKKIVEKGKNQKAVAADLQIPYSTLRDMLTNVGSARVDNVIKLCRYLGITVSELDCAEIDNPKKDDFIIDDHEKDIIRAYRKQSPTVKAAIDRMLEVESPAEEKQAKKTG